MANGYDGDIKLSVGLSLDEATSQAQKLSSEVSKIFNNIDSSKLNSSQQKLLNTMSKTQSQVEKVGIQLDSLVGKMSRSAELQQDFQLLNSTIESTSQKLQEAYTHKMELAQQGFGVDSTEFEQAQNEITELTSALKGLRAEYEELKTHEKELFTEQDLARLDDLKNKMGDLNNQVRMQVSAYQELAAESEEAAQATEQVEQSTQKTSGFMDKAKASITSLAGKVKEGAKTFAEFVAEGVKTKLIIPAISGLKNAFNGLISKIKNASSSSNRLGSSFGSFIKKLSTYALGIATIAVAFNKLRAAITSALTDMAMMNNGMNETNACLSALQASLNYLKGSLGAAFQPILTVVTPILTSFIDQIAEVINAIGMMIAKLTGAKTYFRATKTSANYAASQSSGGSSSTKKTAEEKYQEAVEKAQKKYEKQMEAYEKKVAKAQEKADLKNQESQAKTAEKNAKAQAKAEEQNAKAAEKYAKAQEKANKQLQGFDELNVLTTQDLEDYEEVQAEIYEATEYEPTEYEMPELELPDREDFEDALSGGGGAGDPFGLEEVAIEDFDWDWDWLKDKAEELGRALADNLNDIFSNEQLAHDIGENIAEALNTALHFAYGLVDQLDWRQMGRWLGELVQTGLDTFEWDLLGKTVGETLNGIADTILGFFETYQVGTFGSSLAEAFNNMIETLDAQKLGESVADVLKAPLIELSAFFTDANIAEAGQKFKEFYEEVFTSKSLNGETLGHTIGQSIADTVNAGFEFLLNADVSRLIVDLTTFFEEIFDTAFENIEWASIVAIVGEIIIGCATSLVNIIDDMLIDLEADIKAGMESLNPMADSDEVYAKWEAWAEAEKEASHAVNDQVRQQMVADLEQSLGLMTDTVLANMTWAEKMDSALADLRTAMDISQSAEELTQTLVQIGETYGLTAEDIETLISQFYYEEEALGTVTEGHKLLEDELGDMTWSEYIETQDSYASSIENVGTAAKDTSDTVEEYIKIADDAMEDSKATVEDYSDTAVENLEAVTEAGDNVVISFDTLTEQLGAELESLTGTIDTWYQDMIDKYFGYDVWYTMLLDQMLFAISEFLTVDFVDTWETNMDDWWENKMSPWWDDKCQEWYNDMKENWSTFMDSVEDALEDVVTRIKNTYEDIETATEDTWNTVEATIESYITSAADSVVNNCKDMLTAIAEVSTALSDLDTSMSTGAGRYVDMSPSGSGGSSSGGRGSRVRTFMPMMDIMSIGEDLGPNAFSFPELATGAVIPPNSRFLAVLGDQTSGTNIEAPLDTIKQAFMESLSEMSGFGNSLSNQDIVINIDGREVFRAVVNQNDRYIKSNGVSAFQ